MKLLTMTVVGLRLCGIILNDFMLMLYAICLGQEWVTVLSFQPITADTTASGKATCSDYIVQLRSLPWFSESTSQG